MTMKSAKQPFCRLCGRPLRKQTETHFFGGSLLGRGIGHAHTEDPQTKAEAQRYVNEKIVSVRRGYKGLVVTSWDGESYRTEEAFFDTVRCAAEYGRFAVVNAPGLMTQRYADALERSR